VQHRLDEEARSRIGAPWWGDSSLASNWETFVSSKRSLNLIGDIRLSELRQ